MSRSDRMRGASRNGEVAETATGELSRETDSTRNFAFGEYSRALRLESELADLRAANANRFPCASRGGNDSTRNFAFGEYSHALRLASELADLRAANANR